MISPLPQKPQPGLKYLLDANIWLFLLDQPSNLAVDISKIPHEKRAKILKHRGYIKFFTNLVNSNSQPNIILPAILLSEIVNAYMRKISFPIFQERTGKKSSDIKKFYRPSAQFKFDFQRLKSNMLMYEDFYELVPDEFGHSHNAFNLLSYQEQKIDFNDNFYCSLAKQKKYAIVTDDGDFSVDDVDILTLNINLLP